jgi:hypothetical protein
LQGNLSAIQQRRKNPSLKREVLDRSEREIYESVPELWVVEEISF